LRYRGYCAVDVERRLLCSWSGFAQLSADDYQRLEQSLLTASIITENRSSRTPSAITAFIARSSCAVPISAFQPAHGALPPNLSISTFEHCRNLHSGIGFHQCDLRYDPARLSRSTGGVYLGRLIRNMRISSMPAVFEVLRGRRALSMA